MFRHKDVPKKLGDPKPEKVIKVKKAYKFKKDPTGEAPVFKRIVETRPHRSFINGEPIKEFYSWNFLHVLPKAQNKFPEFKTYEKNIVLGTHRQHDLWDKGSREELRKLPEWNKMFALEAELLVEHRAKYPEKYKS